MTLLQRCRVLRRLLRLTGHVLAGFLQVFLYRLSLGPDWHCRPAGLRRIQCWMQRLNRIIGLRVHVQGRVLAQPALLVANHISWLDIPALAAVAPGVFVAKADVRRWPLLGSLAGLTGTLFLSRYSLAGIRDLLVSLKHRLNAGVGGLVFPEGTSTDGREVKTFFPALFQAAIDNDFPIQAVAIRYFRAGARDELAPFVGEETFFHHLLRVLSVAETQVYLEYAQPLAGGACTRQLAARLTRSWIERRLIGRQAQLRRRARAA